MRRGLAVQRLFCPPGIYKVAGHHSTHHTYSIGSEIVCGYNMVSKRQALVVLLPGAILIVLVMTFPAWKDEESNFRVRVGSLADCVQIDCDNDESISNQYNVAHRKLHVARDSNSGDVQQRTTKKIVQRSEATGDDNN